MLFRKIDLAAQFKISIDSLDLYEQAGLLTPIGADDHVAYSSEFRVAVIAKAEGLGFTFEEIAALLRMGTSQAEDV